MAADCMQLRLIIDECHQLAVTFCNLQLTEIVVASVGKLLSFLLKGKIYMKSVLSVISCWRFALRVR